MKILKKLLSLENIPEEEKLRPILIVNSSEDKSIETRTGNWSKVLIKEEEIRLQVIMWLITTIIMLILSLILFR